MNHIMKAVAALLLLSLNVSLHAQKYGDGLIDKTVAVVGNEMISLSQLEQEVQMAVINRKLNPSLETMFLASSEKYTYLSSTVVKEMARYGANLEEFLPREIVHDVRERMQQLQERTE